MYRVLLLAVGLAVACSTGCFVPYVYPSVCHLPPVEINAPGNTATAFRVDVSERRGRFIGGGVSPKLAFTAQDDNPPPATPQSASVHVNRGVMLYPVLHIGRNGYTCTKLYRRGYRTVVLEPWTDTARVKWEECESIEEQFQAVRDLLFATPWHSSPIRLDSSEPAVNEELPGRIHDRTGWTKDDGHPYTRFSPSLRPGSWSREHRQGLEFARDECKDLLKQGEVDDKLRKRVEYLMHRLDEVIER
jgi:hypothetical protein